MYPSISFDHIMMNEKGQNLIFFGGQQQFSGQVFQLIWNFNMKLIALPETFNQYIGQRFFGGEGIYGECIKQV